MTLLRTAIAVLTGIVLSASAMAQQSTWQQQVQPGAVSQNPLLVNVGIDQKPGALVPMTAQFRDETGEQITFGSLFKGRPILLLPIFFRCTGVCTVEVQGIINALVQSPHIMPGRDLDVVILSIDPVEGQALASKEKQLVVGEYGKKWASSGIHCIYGTMSNIREVTDAIGFKFNYDASTDLVSHPSGIIMLTPAGKVSSYMLSGLYPPSRFRADVARASQQQIAPKTEELFLGCVRCDPLTGKRTLVFSRILQLAGFATLIVLGLSIATLSIRSRRQAT